MNGAQDMGGMMGFGPVRPEPEDVRFHADWEKRALAITLAASATGAWNIDMGRYARESLHPADYLSSTYYEIWTKGLERVLVSTGLLSNEELARQEALGPGKPVKRVLAAADVATTLSKGSPHERPVDTPARFAVGDTIMTKNVHPKGHTRLPRYARGKRGVVERVHGGYVFPDTNAHGEGENPQWLYTVRFSAAELWGESADAGLSVSIDAWESYLEAA